MKLTPTKTPFVVKKMFPDYVWEINTTQKELFLTFDDGPTPEITPWVLDLLKHYNAKATFFCIGSNIEKHPEIFKRIIEEGHRIGNHTHNHIKGWKTKTKDYLENVLETQNVIALQVPNTKYQVPNTKHQIPKTKNQKPNLVNLFRPPYGQIKPKQGKKLMVLGYKIVMWDVLSFDWDKDVTNEGCLSQVISKSKAGSIIVFHDSVKASNNMTYALPKVLEHYSKQGFLFKAIEA